MKIPFQKFNKFVLTNITGTVVDTFVLWIFSNFIFHDYAGKYVFAPAISFECAVFNNYIYSYFWIWKERVPKKYSDFFQRFLLYNVNCAVTFVVKLGLVLLIERIAHLNVVYCNLIALIFTGILNYFIQDKLVFRKQEVVQ